MTLLRNLLAVVALLAAGWLAGGTAAAQATSSAQAAAATAPGDVRFDILAYVVEGDTVLGATAIENAVYPFLGPGRTVADAEAARKALERAYQDAGFLSVVVQLPQQRIDADGELRLVVTQASVESLRVTGARYFLPEDIRQAVPSLAPGTVPDFNAMQAELGQLAAQSPYREITPLLSPGTRPGTLGVELKVQDRLPVQGHFELNSKQSLDTDRGRLEAGLRYNNLFQAGHQLALNAYIAPTRLDDQNILSALYALPVGQRGNELVLGYTRSRSDTPTDLGGATVTRGDGWELRARHRLPSRRGVDHVMDWGLLTLDLQDRIDGVGGFTFDAPSLRYSALIAVYELTLAGSVADRQTTAKAQVSFGLPGLNRRTVDCFGRELDQFRCKRTDADARFAVFKLRLNHREPLGEWTLSAALQGQYTDTPLVPSEQVSYGGVATVRGYFEGEQASDLGAALRLELQTPGWSPSSAVRLSALSFYDAALLRRLYALPSEPQTVQMGSVGLGLRLQGPLGLSASLDWARVLLGTTRAEGDGTRAGNQRWELSVRHAF